MKFKNLILITSSWDDFLSLTNTLTRKEKGDIFEYLTKLILVTHPTYKLQLKEVWIQREGIPNYIREKLNLPSTDEGIDIIAETNSGEYWAIQCKFKGMNETPTYKELSTFSNLANNYCKGISFELLVHTGEKGVKKRRFLGEKYSEIGLDFWLELKSEDWERIHKYIKGKSIRPQPKAPRPHQKKAIEEAEKHFLKNDARRGKLIMPCGTGKSLTSFWIAQKLKANSVIIVVPSLALIKQSLEDWTTEFFAHKEEPIPNWLVICSDESTGKVERDEFVTNAYSLGIPTTKEVDEIVNFLLGNQKGKKIIFVTYQSGYKLAQASKKCNFIFDLAVFDEAHKTVGIKSKRFATLLLDKNISILKRMFMTATERVFRGKNDEIFSMDKTKVYGKLIYQLSFKDAIHSTPPIICDYKILTIAVTNEEIKRLIYNNALLTDKNKKIEEQEALTLASVIALRKATQKYGISHTISFHKSIRSADDFAKLNLIFNKNQLDNVVLNSFHISSKKSAGERSKLLRDFTDSQLALMTNARCLTEGVDIPMIDCILFADPRQSIVEIVQASGRALRPYKTKKFGYIMLPLIIPDDQTLEEFTESTSFKTVAKIISALSTQDERIAEEFRLTYNGKQENTSRQLIFDGTVPIGMNLDFSHFVENINIKIWEHVGRANWLPYKEAIKFVHKLKLKGANDWYKYCKLKIKPADIPTAPRNRYLGKGWNGWGDWCGTFFVNFKERKENYLPFEEAREFVRKLNIRNMRAWKKYTIANGRPINIPSHPAEVYKNDGWAGFGDWLGTGQIAYRKKKYRSFEEARAFVQNLKLKNTHDWKRFCRSHEMPQDIPAGPESVYKEWKGLGDWLGTGNVNLSIKGNRKYLSYEEVKKSVRTLNLKSKNEWEAYIMTKGKPYKFPPLPQNYYKNNGWMSWEDWLGITGDNNESVLSQVYENIGKM